MVPDGTVGRITALELKGGLLGPLLKRLIHLGFCTGCRIDLLQLRDRKGRLLRILSRIAFVKIAKLRLTLL